MTRRRNPLAATCALVLTLALPAAAEADGPASYQADPAHSGAAAGTTFAPPLGKRWVRRDLGGPTSFPVIAEGKAFLAAGPTLYALNLADGATAWSRPITTTGVAYDAGRVFAVDSHGVMHALSAANGQPAWSTKLTGPSSYFSAPTAYGGYVHAASPGVVFGVRQSDGLVVWATRTTADETSIPAVDGDKVYSSGACGQTSALQRTLGVELWRYENGCVGSGGGITPAVAGGRVYAQDLGLNVTVLDSLTGMATGAVEGGGPPALAGDSGYYRNARQVFARSESSGAVQWRRDTDALLVAPPLVAGGFVYALDGLGDVLAFSRGGGDIVWQRSLATGWDDGQRTPFRGLAASGSMLLVASGDRVTAFAPGPDTPGVEEPDKPPAGSGAVVLEPRATRTVFRKPISVEGRIEHSFVYGSTLEVQADRWPFGTWEHLRDVKLDSEWFSLVLRPDRNTRYRAIYRGTYPEIVSPELKLLSDVRFGFRVFARGRRHVLVKVSLAGPRDAGLRTRPVFAYHYRARASSARRVGTLRLRGRGTKARAARVLRTPTLRRTDLFFVCRRERRDDGFGPPEPRLRLCGRRILR